jgi:hypothetical protein
MVQLLILDAFFVVLLILSSSLGVIDAARAGQALLGIALINIALAVFSYLDLPFLRGDVPNRSSLNRRDAVEKLSGARPSKPDRPTRNFVFGLAGLGVLALASGLVFVY